MKVTYYLDVISSWCHWAEPVWAELQRRYGKETEFGWKIALMDASGLPVSRDQLEWFYRRSGIMMRSSYQLNSGWYDPAVSEYLAPNAVAEAARDLGVADDSVRIAIAQAAVLNGKRVGDWDVSVRIASEISGLNEKELLTRAQSPEIDARLRATTREFHALGITQRPAFVIENAIGDRAVFSGVARVESLAAAIESLLQDQAAYDSWKAHFGDPPTGLLP
jgi:predicted DsbA family dithiol-disulfide isomerase